DQDHCCGILTLAASFLLGQVVVRGLLSQAKALIALLRQRDDVVRRQLVALRPGQRGSVHDAADGGYAEDRGDGRDAADREKAASVHTIVSARSHAPFQRHHWRSEGCRWGNASVMSREHTRMRQRSL